MSINTNPTVDELKAEIDQLRGALALIICWTSENEKARAVEMKDIRFLAIDRLIKSKKRY